MMIVTVASAAHLPRAMVMAASVKRHMPDARLVIGMVEDSIPVEASSFPLFDEVVLVKHIGIYPSFHKFIFQYRNKEGAGSCKPHVLKYAYHKYTDEQTFVYMDTDMIAMGPFAELDAIPRNKPIILTGHYLSAEPFDRSKFDMLKLGGIYNSGLLILRRHEASVKFIDWWLLRTEKHGYIDRKKKMFTDQTWLDFVPGFFEHVYVLRHPGYNMAPWNFAERQEIEVLGEDRYNVNGLPLRCFHFSGLSTFYLKHMHRLPASKQQIISHMRSRYIMQLNAYGQGLLGTRAWSYDYYANGQKISDGARVSNRNKEARYANVANPFLLSNRYFGAGGGTRTKGRKAVTRKLNTKRNRTRAGKRIRRRSSVR